MSEKQEHSTRLGLRFAVMAGILTVTFFALLRVGWVERNILLPFTGFQESVACRIGGDPNSGVRVDLSCSGADVIALCMGFVLAFPVPWRKRFTGALLGLAVISVVNTVRIATLTHAIRDRFWFNALHLYIWPAFLIILVAVYVFLWMNTSSPRTGSGGAEDSLARRLFASPLARRFLPLTVLFVLVFVGASDWLYDSAWLKTVATWATGTAGLVLAGLGVEAQVTGNILRTANGGFIVTQECMATPLIPIYFAAALSLPLMPVRRTAMLLSALPVFFLLGSARLLVLALPLRLVGSHTIAIHAFYQLLTALLLIAGAAYLQGRRDGNPAGTTIKKALLATLVGASVGIALGPAYNKLLLGITEGVRSALDHAVHIQPDPQGALRLLPAYQLALLAGLWMATAALRPTWRRLALGMACLMLFHPLLLLGLGELSGHWDVNIHVAAIRALAVLAPVLLAWLLLRRPSATRSAPAMALAEAPRG